MSLTRARANLLIAGVIVLAVVAYAGYAKEKWKEFRGEPSFRSSDTTSSSALDVRVRRAEFKSRVPNWLPLYPGTVPDAISSSQAGIEHYFTVRMHTSDHCYKVVSWYEDTLKRAGYETYGRFQYEDPACTSTLQADGPGFHRSFRLSASGGVRDVSISVTAVEREVSSGAEPSIPKWVPMYPTAERPKHLDATSENNGEYHLNFSFSNGDDSAKVYRWYQVELKKRGLTATFETAPRSAGKLESHTADNRRVFNIHNSPEAAANAFIIDVFERQQ
jgi:hypothetical protein